MTKIQAIRILLIIISSTLLLHALILIKIIPYNIAWGGRIQTDEAMYVFETLSILLNLILGIALLIKGSFIKQFVGPKIVNVTLWIFLLLFALNTIGNLLAKTNFEKFFAILTLGLCILLVIVLKKPASKNA